MSSQFYDQWLKPCRDPRKSPYLEPLSSSAFSFIENIENIPSQFEPVTNEKAQAFWSNMETAPLRPEPIKSALEGYILQREEWWDDLAKYLNRKDAIKPVFAKADHNRRVVTLSYLGRSIEATWDWLKSCFCGDLEAQRKMKRKLSEDLDELVERANSDHTEMDAISAGVPEIHYAY